MKRLGDVVEVIAGQAAPKTFGEIGLPFIRAGHLDSLIQGDKLDDLPKVTDEVAKSKRLKKIPKGTILFAKSGMSATKNRILITKNDAYFVSHLAGILPNNKFSSSYLSKFLYWFNPTNLILDEAYPSIRLVDINNLKIPLPPLEQQKKIAAILDAADTYRQKTKALITKYDALTQSLFLDMFGDPFTNKKNFPVFKLGELCNELFLGLTSKVEYVEKGGFPLIRAKDINKGVLSFEKVKYISEKQHRKITARRITKRGDVLISKSGTLGTCAIVDSDREFTTYESIFTVRPKEGLLSNIFLVYLVRNEGFKLKLLGNKVGGTVAHLNLKMFRDFEFPLPNIQKQKKFTKRAQAIEAQKAQAQDSLSQAEDLFNSLLQKAFKGELTN